MHDGSSTANLEIAEHRAPDAMIAAVLMNEHR